MRSPAAVRYEPRHHEHTTDAVPPVVGVDGHPGDLGPTFEVREQRDEAGDAAVDFGDEALLRADGSGAVARPVGRRRIREGEDDGVAGGRVVRG